MEYREYRPGDEKQLNDLYNEVFSRQRTIEQWKWQHVDAPAGPSKIVVIEHEGEIIAHEAMIPLQFHTLDGEYLAGKLEDAYISAKHRGKGLFGPLEDYCLKVGAGANFRFTFGMTARDVAYRIHIKRGYRQIGCLNAHFAPLKPSETVTDIARLLQLSFPKRLAVKAVMDVVARRFDAKVEKRANEPDKYEIQRVERFDERFDELWRAFTKGRQFISVERSSAFLNWRYIDNPYRKYAVFAARSEGRAVGYLAASVVTREDMDLRLKVGIVADFLVLPGYESAYPSFVRRAVRAWRSGGADVAIAWLHRDGVFSRPLSNELKRWGFVSTFGRYDIPFLVRAFSSEINTETLYDIGRWHVTHAFGAAWV